MLSLWQGLPDHRRQGKLSPACMFGGKRCGSRVLLHRDIMPGRMLTPASGSSISLCPPIHEPGAAMQNGLGLDGLGAAAAGCCFYYPPADHAHTYELLSAGPGTGSRIAKLICTARNAKQHGQALRPDTMLSRREWQRKPLGAAGLHIPRQSGILTLVPGSGLLPASAVTVIAGPFLHTLTAKRCWASPDEFCRPTPTPHAETLRASLPEHAAPRLPWTCRA